VSPEAISGRVSVINFLPADKQQAMALTGRLAKIHQSFNETEDVVFLSFIEADSTVKLLDLATDLGIYDHNQWFLIETTVSERQRIANEVFRIPDVEIGVALVDTSLTIRKYYDINSNEQMGRLVEHIALIIPKQKRR
jgi:hypothetical protein